MEPVTLVDAENVRRSEWPNIGRDELAPLVRVWADAVGARVVLVFDGPAPEAQDGKRFRVVGTEGESADDWIARAAERLAREERPYRLVTSDRGLRARAGGHADDVVGGGTFAQILRAVPTGAARRHA